VRIREFTLCVVIGIASLSGLPSVVIAADEAGPAGSGPEIVRPEIREVLRIVYGPSPLDSFRRPAGILTDPVRGLLFVADGGGHRVAILDELGRNRGTIPFSGTGRPAVPGEPTCLAADARGRLYVVDEMEAAVRVLTPRGSALARIPVPIESPGSDGTRPRSVDVGASGLIYLLYDGGRRGIAVLDERGRVRPELGVGPDAGIFASPTAIAVRDDENVLAVVDPQARRQVILLTPLGRVIAAFGEHGEGDGTLSMASHVAWGPGDTLWVTDTLRHSINVFDSNGRYLGRIGGFGRGPGQFLYPAACGFLGSGRLVVVERGAGRCQVLDVAVPSSGDGVPAPPWNASPHPEA
jgi:DNA-binding beta-propeller fold protein YncE